MVPGPSSAPDLAYALPEALVEVNDCIISFLAFSTISKRIPSPTPNPLHLFSPGQPEGF